MALAATSDREWNALVVAMGQPDWATARDLATPEGRSARADELDRGIAEWTRDQPAKDAAEMLRKSGVPASTLLEPPGMYGEAQLEARDYYQTLDHPVSGERRYPVWPMRFSFMPTQTYQHGAPTLGQHNEEVLRGELGLSADAFAKLVARGVIGDRMPD